MARGCCWRTNLAEENTNVPRCFYPKGFSAYQLSHALRTEFGWRFVAQKEKTSFLKSDSLKIMADLTFYEGSIARLTVSEYSTDTNNVKDLGLKKTFDNNDFELKFERNPFNLKLINRHTKQIVLDTTVGPLLIADNHVELTTKLSRKFLYGIGQRSVSLKKTASWETIRMDENKRDGGSLPFVMFPDKYGHFSGIFVKSSPRDQIDVIVQPMPAITIRSRTNKLDLFVYAGGNPSDVVYQHQKVMGSPSLVPYWSLGLHTRINDLSDLKSLSGRLDTVIVDANAFNVRSNDDLENIADKKVALVDARLRSSVPEQFDGYGLLNMGVQRQRSDLDSSFLLSDSVRDSRGGVYLNTRRSGEEDDVYLSVVEVINNNLMGMPLLSGILMDTTRNADLHERWMHLSAYLPLMMTDFSSAQSSVINKVTSKRYEMAPQLYGAVRKAALHHTPIVQPLFFHYPKDRIASWIDTQFILDNTVMVVPILQPNAKSVAVYIPDETWTPMFNYKHNEDSKWQSVQLSDPHSPLVLLKQGNVFFRHIVDSTKTLLGNRQSPFKLVIVPDDKGAAHGQLYWANENETESTLVNVVVIDGKKVIVSADTDGLEETLLVQQIEIFSNKPEPKLKHVTVNSNDAQFEEMENKIVVNCQLNMNDVNGNVLLLA
ncbi:hypothetical protein ACOME3_008350 [Neoechinorhynchus agilis]